MPLLLEEGSAKMTTGAEEKGQGECDGPLLSTGQPSVSAMMNQASMWSCVAVLVGRAHRVAALMDACVA